MTRNILLAFALLSSVAGIKAQTFFNLTANEVKIDTVMPRFTQILPLGAAYADSVYTVSVDYPEYIDMSDDDIARMKSICPQPIPEFPVVESRIVVERKKGLLEVSFVPIVFKDGKYRKLVSFMLRLKSKAKAKNVRRSNALKESAKSARYASNSVLATGSWAKIRVPSTGVYQLTDALIRQAGFNDLSKVKVYGYGGALHDETLTETSIKAYDDLKEIPTCSVAGKKLFRATGPITWQSNTATARTRNPYSDYGYYFITQNDSEPLSVDSATFVSSFYPSPDDYHALHEVDDYAWFQGGRNLYEQSPINSGSNKVYQLTAPQQAVGHKAIVYVNISSYGVTSGQISVNDSIVGTITTSKPGEYDRGGSRAQAFTINNLATTNEIKITNTGSNTIRLDYISIVFSEPRPEPQLSVATFSVPEYVYNITNQNHHADKQCDMVIIVPTSQKLLAQAERLKEHHEQHDSLKVQIVPADELYNEFSSGTPEADAYRLYMKMLYDRAETDEDMPKYLLLFGDGKWDNRMKTSALNTETPDDYLLCFESENSFSYTESFVDDCYFTALDDGEGNGASGSSLKTDKYDIAVGRFPVATAEAAKIVVDKTLSYVENKNAGEWQNIAAYLGDDGNNNGHIQSADGAAKIMESLAPSMQAKRVFWDMYTRVFTATGNTYPEVTSILKKQQTEGALLFDYAGHGRADMMSHEQVLTATDFSQFKNKVYPFWITASCDIAPWDGTETNIGVTAMLNPSGGSVAFYGTTRTVYMDGNQYLNNAYIRSIFTMTDGKYPSIGEAQRLAKNYIVTSGQDRTKNKLQFSLLGDPALKLKIPEHRVVVDSINGICLATATELPRMKAGATVNVKGHVENTSGKLLDDFTGKIKLDVRDSKEKIVGKKNSTETPVAYEYYDYTKTIFNGSDSIRNGKFNISFAVTKDINYSDENGRIYAFAVNGKNNETANGMTESFIVGGTENLSTDSIGPSVYCYLNSPTFSNGDNVNATPYFVAELSDKDGLNTSGSGIGHDLTLVIDGDPMKTYTLNDNFSFDFGSYTKGSTYYYIPELEAGAHKLKFTAWDILNNPSTTTLSFNVVRGLTPSITSINCTNNPAKGSTTFIVNHNRGGSDVNVLIEVFDTSGRILWQHNEETVSETSTYTYNWDLASDSGSKLQAGIYLYRVRLSSDGSSEATKAKKLIVIN